MNQIKAALHFKVIFWSNVGLLLPLLAEYLELESQRYVPVWQVSGIVTNCQTSIYSKVKSKTLFKQGSPFSSKFVIHPYGPSYSVYD